MNITFKLKEKSLLIVAIGLASNKSIKSFMSFVLAFSCTIPLALLFAYISREEK